MGRKKLISKVKTEAKKAQILTTPFKCVFINQRLIESRSLAATEERNLINDEEDLLMQTNDCNDEESKVIDIMSDTKDLTLMEIIDVVAKELGFLQRENQEIRLIECKLNKISLNSAPNNRDEHLSNDLNASPNANKQREKNDETIQFYAERKKNSRIPDKHKIRLVMDAKKNSLSIFQICRKYFIGYSTAKSILKEVTDYQKFPLYQESKLNQRKLERLHIKKSIDEFLCTTRDAITIRKIRAHVMKKCRVDIPWHQVRKYLREKKLLSFKKGCGRRIDLDQNRLSYLRILYSILLSKQINENILLINIDEVNFSPKVVNCRSWLKKGTSCEIFSHKYSGAVSLICAINSEGDYLAAILNDRLNSCTFIEFLKMISYWIHSNDQSENKNVMILLDNCSIHRSKLSIEHIKTTQFKFMFLPHYTPSLAPIELVFAKLKQTVSNIYTNEITDWNSRRERRILNEGLKSIDANEIIRCWNHALKVSEKYIDDFKYRIQMSK